MPRFNQQGPMGEGPMTGRKMGKCTNYGEKIASTEEQLNENVEIGGRGFGMRRGRCFGQGRGFAGGEGQGFGKGRGAGRGRGRFGQGQGRNRSGLTE